MVFLVAVSIPATQTSVVCSSFTTVSPQKPKKLMTLQKNVGENLRNTGVKAVRKTLLPFSSTFCHSLFFYLLSAFYYLLCYPWTSNLYGLQ